MNDRTYLLIGAGAAAVVIAALVARKAVSVAGDALQAINPVNNDNIINQGVTSVYQVVTGSEGTIGSDIYDHLHSGKNGEFEWGLYSRDAVENMLDGLMGGGKK